MVDKNKIIKWTLKDVSWWKFWDIRSGVRGGLIAGVILASLIWFLHLVGA